MAVLFEKFTDSTHYQVRTAGSSIRLYTNGVFHTQYNPTRRHTGSVWDLLLVPALLNTMSIRRTLLLGVGGGGIIHMLRSINPTMEFVGVEIDPVHVNIAQQFFNLDKPEIKLFANDAREFVEHYKGPSFDLIIDDLFGSKEQIVSRAFTCDQHWFNQLNNCLSSTGTLICNFADLAEFKVSPFKTVKGHKPGFKSGFTTRLPTLENLIAALCRDSFGQPLLEENTNAYFGKRQTSKISIRSIPRR